MKTFLAILLVAFCNVASAEQNPIGDLLNAVFSGLENKNQAAPQPSPQSASTSDGRGSWEAASGLKPVGTAESFCSLIENDPTIKEYSRQLARSMQLPHNEQTSIRRLNAFDDQSGSLLKLVNKELELDQYREYCPTSNSCYFVVRAVKHWSEQCALKHIDDDLFYFFQNWEGSSKPVAERRKDLLSRKGEGLLIPLRTSYFATLMALVIPKTNPIWIPTAQYNTDQFKRHLDRMEQEDKESKAKEAAFETKKAKDEADELAIRNSPTGKLVIAYRQMGFLVKCRKAREGYQFVYINDEEFARNKKLMQRIETSLKGKLPVGTNTEALWTEAYAFYNFDEFVQQAKWLYGIDAQNVCQQFQAGLEKHAESILGKSTPTKSW